MGATGVPPVSFPKKPPSQHRHSRQRRPRKAWVTAGLAGLLLVAMAATGAAILIENQRREADARRIEAEQARRREQLARKEAQNASPGIRSRLEVLRGQSPCRIARDKTRRLQRNEEARFYHWKSRNRLPPLRIKQRL